jgi:hypothetical protein
MLAAASELSVSYLDIDYWPWHPLLYLELTTLGIKEATAGK